MARRGAGVKAGARFPRFRLPAGGSSPRNCPVARGGGLSFNAAVREARLQRWPWLTSFADRLWDEYDRLHDWQRVGLGVAAALLLAATALYCLGAASLIALSRLPPTATAESPP